MCKYAENGIDLIPCDPVAWACDHSKGFRISCRTDMKTMKRRPDRLMLFTGKFRKGGAILNFCPFTGDLLEPPVEKSNSGKQTNE